MSKSDLQERLENLPPDQFAEAKAAFDAARAARGNANQGDLSRKLGSMTDAEFARYRDEQSAG